jgi:thiaminase
MNVKIIYVVLVLVGLLIGAGVSIPVTSKIKDKEFARTEKVYEKTIDRYAASYDTLASKARYMISQTLTIKKNKKGQTIFVPSSTMEIDPDSRSGIKSKICLIKTVLK